MFTKEAQELAKHCYEAIKVIAERQEKECPKCEGAGQRFYPDFDDSSKEDYLDKCDCKNGKLKWEWEPEVGEWCIVEVNYKEKVKLIPHINGEFEKSWYIRHSIPLLHWERIEEILEGMGYDLSIDIIGATGQVYLPPQGHHIEIHDRYNKLKAEADAETRQEAVQKAIIEWGRGSK